MNITITKKIWLSLSVIIAGYMSSMLFSISFGEKTISRLDDISECLLPITLSSQTALIKYNEQIKMYNNAIMTGEVSLMASANECAELVQKSLQTILSNQLISEKNYRIINQINEKYLKFTQEAQAVYSILCQDSGISEEQMLEASEKAKSLAKDKSAIENSIKSLSTVLAEGLKNEFSDIVKCTHFSHLISICVFVFVVLAAILLNHFIISRFIKNPLNKTISMLKDIAQGEGNLTARIEIENKDEIGEFASWFNIFILKLQDIIKNLTQNAKELGQSSGHLTGYAKEMILNMENLTTTSKQVASATEQLTANINSMAISSEEMSMNINNIAEASEDIANNMNNASASTHDMTESIKSIGVHIQNGQSISTEAMTLSSEATQNMNLLGRAAREIGKVTDVIKRISVQTNLLALNASIEASTAGEAGRGFAVVAEKIKQFASQSTQSAENIAQKINDVQSKTTNAVDVIEKVSHIIDKISESYTSITMTIEKQIQTTSDLSLQIDEINNRTNTIASSIYEFAIAVNEVSKHSGDAANKTNSFSEIISTVQDAAETSEFCANNVQASATELDEIATKLNEIINKFIV